MESESTTSCQVVGIKRDIWIRFRQQCIESGLSINRRLKLLIAAEVENYEAERLKEK